MAESEEKGYEVIDKRKVRIDENGEVTAAEQEAEVEASAAAGEAEEPDLGDYPLPPADVYNMLRSFISILGMNVWPWLGLLKSPTTGEMVTDLEQAKIAIDTIAFMVEKLEPKLEPSERREIQNMLSDLRMNYVAQNKK